MNRLIVRPPMRRCRRWLLHRPQLSFDPRSLQQFTFEFTRERTTLYSTHLFAFEIRKKRSEKPRFSDEPARLTDRPTDC